MARRGQKVISRFVRFEQLKSRNFRSTYVHQPNQPTAGNPGGIIECNFKRGSNNRLRRKVRTQKCRARRWYLILNLARKSKTVCSRFCNRQEPVDREAWKRRVAWIKLFAVRRHYWVERRSAFFRRWKCIFFCMIEKSTQLSANLNQSK